MLLLLILVVPFIAFFFIILLSSDKESDKDHNEESEVILERSEHWREESFCADPLWAEDDEYDAWCRKHNAEEIGYKIAGINFRKLDSSHVGPFDGVMLIEPENPYDPNAVAIFRGRKKVGYIPKEYNELVFNELLKMGGGGPCIGFIHTFINEDYQEKFAGMVIGPIHGSDEKK